MANFVQVPTSLGTVSVQIPNVTTDGDGFFVSFNDRDSAIYGSDTTALVFGQMQAFYILNGDHRAAYSSLIPQGFDACLDYFKANVQHANKFSDKVEGLA